MHSKICLETIKMANGIALDCRYDIISTFIFFVKAPNFPYYNIIDCVKYAFCSHNNKHI